MDCEVRIEADETGRLEEEDDLDPEQVGLPHVRPEPLKSPGHLPRRGLDAALRVLAQVAHGRQGGQLAAQVVALLRFGHAFGDGRDVGGVFRGHLGLHANCDIL